MSKPTQNEPNPRLEYGLRGSKVPLIYGRVSAPQSNIKQMGIYRPSFIISRKVGQSVFAHFWLNEAETPSAEGSAGSLLFRGGQPRTLPPFLGWGRGRLWKTPRSGQQSARHSGPYYPLDPSTRELFLGLGSSSSGSQTLL